MVFHKAEDFSMIYLILAAWFEILYFLFLRQTIGSKKTEPDNIKIQAPFPWAVHLAACFQYAQVIIFLMFYACR